MPWGWECRARLVKQLPGKPTERRGKSKNLPTPAPNKYDVPQIFCGKGFDRIKRAPAYTFGKLTKVGYCKPPTTPLAPMFNIQNLGKTGPFKVTHGVVTPHIEPISDKSKKPGPATYTPNVQIQQKRHPAYSIRPAARPPYQPWDMWTPSPNMYCPDKPCKKPPAYTLGNQARDQTTLAIPGPGTHDPKFNYVKKSKPSYTFGYPYKKVKPLKTPPPNIYCEKKFMYPKRSIPAPTFGIRHSKYLGVQPSYLKSSKLDLTTQ